MAANKRKPETPVPDEEEEVEYVETSEEEEEEVEEVEEEEEEEEVEEEEEDDNEDEVEEEEDNEEEEEESEETKRESVKKLLEPFSKDQILELLKTAALQSDSIINQITQSADKDTTHRKVFVHGLGWDCTNETLLSSFKQYGEIELGNVVTDKTTGKSKGYGFILFKTRKAAAKAIKEPQKKIGNRMTACQLAAAGPFGANQNQNQNQNQNHKLADSSVSARKIYVANVASHLNPEKLREFFEKFGEIEEGPIGFDRATGKLKGYALFVYRTVEGCNKALEQPTKLFEGTQLHCKKAFDKTQIGAGENAMGVGSLPLNYMNPAAAASLAGPQAIGILSPAAAFANSTGYSPSLARGLSPLTSRSDTVGSNLGLGAGYGMQSSINSISPSVIGNYGSQAALQGLGAYQSSQLGQSSAAAQSALGSLGAFPSYLGR